MSSSSLITLFGEVEFEIPVIAGSSSLNASFRQVHKLNREIQTSSNLICDAYIVNYLNTWKRFMEGSSTISVDLSQVQFLEPLLINGNSVIEEPSIRLNSDPNVFIEAGEAAINCNSVLSVDIRKTHRLKAAINGSTSIRVIPRTIEAESAVLKGFIQMAPSFEEANTEVIDARFLIDDFPVPVKRFELNQSSTDMIQVVEIDFSKPLRSQISYDSNFKLQLKKSSFLDWETVLEGSFSRENFSIAYQQDYLGATIVDDLFSRFNKFPHRPIIIYNNLELSVEVTEFEVPVDTDGNRYTTQLITNPDLSLYDIFDFVFIDNLGFDNWHTTIPNYNITRVDFQMTSSFLSVVNSLIGMFEPVIFNRDNEIWILDTSQNPPEGLPVREFNPSNSRISKTVDLSDIHGYEIEFTASAGEFFIPRVEEFWRDITPDLRNHYEYTYRDYYSFSRPDVILRTDLISERITQEFQGVTRGESYTENTYNTQGSITSSRKKVTAYLPDLSNNGALTLLHVLDDVNEYQYSTVRTGRNLRRNMLVRHINRISGLYAIDSANPSFDSDFLQPFMDAYISGNLSLDMTSAFGPLKTITKELKVLAKGQTKVKVTVFNELYKTIEDEYEEPVSGEGRIPTQTNKSVILWNPNVLISDRKVLASLSIGELPLKYGIELAKRKLEKIRNKKGRMSVYQLSFDLTKQIGSVFSCVERNNLNLGTGIIVGRKISYDGTNSYSPKLYSSYELIEL